MRSLLLLEISWLALAACGPSIGPENDDGTGSGAASASFGDSGGSADSTAGDDAPVLELRVSPIKRFDFSWQATAGVGHYELLESIAPGEPFELLAGDIVGESISFTMPLHLRVGASYMLRACGSAGCVESAPVTATGPLIEAIGYLKASNTDSEDLFGHDVALSHDGSTLAVGAPCEDSPAIGIDGDGADDTLPQAGAVYVLTRDASGQWSQQAYVKASNTDRVDYFGENVTLSADGNTLAVSATTEDSSAAGIDGDQADDSLSATGTVHVFTRDSQGQWSQQAYLKASNPGRRDRFGSHLALSGDGNTLVVAAHNEESNATGIDGDQTDDSLSLAGTVYAFARDSRGQWSQQAYLKASNTQGDARFGSAVALSHDGNTLAVGSFWEDGGATGIDGDQSDVSAPQSGAVYMFVRDPGGQWSQQAYIKASNTDESDEFGISVALSGDGNTLAVGAADEQSSATGIDGDQADDSSNHAGAAYVFVRDTREQWSQQAYIKASNTDGPGSFGFDVALGSDGTTLAVSALYESSQATGIDGDQADDSAHDAGAVYVFVRDPMARWSQRAYVKAPNPGPDDAFGISIALSGDGNTLAVGAIGEDGSATGIGGDQANDATTNAGAAYLY